MSGWKLRTQRGYTAENGKCVEIVDDLGGGLFRGYARSGSVADVIIYREDGTALVDGWHDFNIKWPPRWEPEDERIEALSKAVNGIRTTLHEKSGDYGRRPGLIDRIAAVEEELKREGGMITPIAFRMTAVEAAVARIEDMLIAEKRPEPVRDACCETGITLRKSLGWVNVYSYGSGALHSTRDEADRQIAKVSSERLACIEVFEGDGL